MSLHTIKKGLELPINGAPEQILHPAKAPKTIALLADDYVGMKPTFRVKIGDAVKRGQTLFEDKKNPGVLYTAPGAGTIGAITRGERRAFRSITIELNDNERNDAVTDADMVTFSGHSGSDLASLTSKDVESLLIESGLWTAFRTRPFSKVPAPGSKPVALFVTAMDSHPLAPSMDVIAEGRQDDLDTGMLAVSKLCDGRAIYCKAPDMTMAPAAKTGVTIEEFAGPHPSGTAGLHIHTLEPVGRAKTVWSIGLQDLLAIGALFNTGKLDVSRIISLAGPGVERPRLLRSRLGAATNALVEGELKAGEQRIISGSVLSGRIATGEILGYLGRYHQQVSALTEGRERELFGWAAPGANKFSLLKVFLSKLSPNKKFDFTTTTNGSKRAIVPIGMYEKVMPLDILPTFLLRSLAVDDIGRAEELGCLELDEEDLALCTFVCPGKNDYGSMLRRNLNMIDKEL
jgi:Na+-transporting NADH:ubiquinone oxidoreductase subunit A